MERLEKLKEFLKSNPGDPFLNHALALEYIKLGELSEARRVFEGLLERDPDYVGSYYHLAKLLETTGQNEEAVKWYELGIQKAKQAGDRHALSELQAAYEDLVD